MHIIQVQVSRVSHVRVHQFDNLFYIAQEKNQIGLDTNDQI
jgi:hypothetical protein